MANPCNVVQLGGGMPDALIDTDLPGLKRVTRGKVRDVYDLGERLLIVASDRISAFDSILQTPIPDKGRVLHQLTLFWLNRFAGVMPNHFLTESLDELGLPAEVNEVLKNRSMIVKKAEALPIECVVRGYIIGGGWKDYQKSGSVCGIALRPGMQMADKLDAPIFTPTTKATEGHDENISFEQARQIVGADIAGKVRDAAITLYTQAADYALTRGIIIADTKFEFGLLDGNVILIDEALTPDSSRFWPADSYKPGISPPSFDKQYVRDWLENESGWDKEPPAPALPLDVVVATRAKYVEALERLSK